MSSWNVTKRRLSWLVPIFLVLYFLSPDEWSPAGSNVLKRRSLNLRLDLPISVDDRAFIVSHYIGNLQSELEGRSVQYQDVDSGVFQKRKEHTDKMCKNWTSGRRFRLDPSYVQHNTWYLSQQKLMHCPVAKGGSTFWRRAFEVIQRRNSQIVSPFQLSYLDFNEGKAKIPYNLTRNENLNVFPSFMQSTLKFVFTREPYHRVFSAFIDKILSPNTYMWYIGKNAISMFRSSAQNGSGSCGADVTFAEFIKLVNTQNPETFNPHFKPVAFVCDPCKYEFDIYGKMETFQDDTRYILKTIGSLGHEIVFQDMNIEYQVDFIVDAVVRSFAYISGWSKCISVHAGMQRLWRQLQIAGLVDITDKYSLSTDQSNNITVTEYLNMALGAYKRSSASAKTQKTDAFLQAYSTLNFHDLEILREKFLIDFEMFGYDSRPAQLFDKKDKKFGGFDYFDVMRLK